MQKGLTPIALILGVILLIALVMSGYILTTKPQGPVYMSPLPAPSINPTNNTPADRIKIQKACRDAGGQWLDEFNECESSSSDQGLDEQACQNLGGSYQSCASACRHNPKTEVCIQVCVKVCKFTNLDQKSAFSCVEVRKKATDPNAGISFEQAYCTGFGCSDIKTQKDCEARDFAKIEKGYLIGGQDGEMDCKWQDSLQPFCVPNK